MTTPNETDYLNISSAMYDKTYNKLGTHTVDKDQYGYPTTSYQVTASTHDDSERFESNGLQASVVKVDGQTVVAFCSSQDMTRAC